MSLIYDNDLEEMTMDCDHCSNSIDDLSGSWQDCIDEAKSQGWTITKQGDEYIHICPDCKYKI